MADAHLLFLPWLRQGFAARVRTPDTLAPSLPATVELNLVLDAGAGADNPGAKLRLRGPADVIGIDPRQVVRTEPAADSIDFEALDLAAIEFDNPDLPWLFTPAAANAQGRLRPWIALVVVRVRDGVRVRPAGREALPVLEIAASVKLADELPDLAESWAWAHVQLSWPHAAPADEAGVRTLLATRPELSVSRLLCPRRLAAHTDYIACVVPAFEVGRCAGLDRAPPANDLAPAWTLGDAASTGIELPVYFHWQFRTGAREDFESIVDRLTPRDLSGEIGQRPMDVVRPGFAVAVPAGLSGLAALEGALQPVDRPRGALADSVGPTWQPALQQILNASAAPSAAGDPIVGPPVYGRGLAARERVELGGSPDGPTPMTPTWFDELNLDPRERVAAALGTRVIQAQQDELVAQAWAQAGEIAAANQRLRQTQLACAIGTRLQQRHVAPLAQGAQGQDDALWRLAAPAQARLMLRTPDAAAAPMAMAALLAQTGVSATVLAAPMRRLTAGGGALSRRSTLLVRKFGGSALAPRPISGRLVTSPLAVAPASSILSRSSAAPKSLVTIDDVSARTGGANAGLLYAGMTDAAVAGAPQRAGFTIEAEPPPFFELRGMPLPMAIPPAPEPLLRARPPGTEAPVPEPPEPPEPRPPRPPRPPIPRPQDTADAAAFRIAAKRHLALVNPAPPPPPPLPRFELATLLTTQRTTLMQQLDPLPALQLRLHASIAAWPVPAEPDAAVPLGHALGLVPRYALPASEPLARLSQDWLLPGLQHVGADTVALLQANQRFIEAFMLGLNVEMTRELLWRDFPLAHELGTHFERFWRAARAGTPPDILPINQWGTRRLGRNAPPPGQQPLVLLLRSVLLQRYPGTAVYAVRGVAQGTQRRPPDGEGEQKAPLFRGSLEPDVSFFGFDLDPLDAVGNPGWYFVLQQQPTEPRFGFDEPVDFAGASHVSVNRRPTGAPELPTTTPWADNAAQLADLIRQRPVRVMIHASELLPPPKAPAPAPALAPAPAPAPAAPRPPSTRPPSTRPPSTRPPSTKPPSTKPPSTKPPSTKPPAPSVKKPAKPRPTKPPSTKPSSPSAKKATTPRPTKPKPAAPKKRAPKQG